MTNFNWECITSDDTIFKEIDGSIYNLDWEKPNAVKSFVVSNGQDTFLIDFNLMQITLNGNKLGDIPANSTLKFFKRNFIDISQFGTPMDHRINYYLGYTTAEGKEHFVELKVE